MKIVSALVRALDKITDTRTAVGIGGRTHHLDAKLNPAQQLQALLGARDEPEFPKPRHRYATAPRQMRRGEDGMRKPGRYGKGLRNWCNGKASKGRV